MLARYPVAVPSWGRENSVCPAGSSYFPVVRMESRPNSELYLKYKVMEVIPCVEQLVGQPWSNEVETWPAGIFSISSRFDPADGPVDATGAQTEGEHEFLSQMRERNGVWRDVTLELQESNIHSGGYDAEDFGSELSYEADEEESAVTISEEEVPESEADYGGAESARG